MKVNEIQGFNRLEIDFEKGIFLIDGKELDQSLEMTISFDSNEISIRAVMPMKWFRKKNISSDMSDN